MQLLIETKLQIKKLEEAISLLNKEGEIFVRTSNTKVKIPVFHNIFLISFIEKENKIIDIFELKENKIIKRYKERI